MKTLKNKWLLLVINAILALIVGLVLLLVPQASLKSLGLLAGVLIFLAGLFLILGTFIYSEGQKTHPMWLLEGIINVSLGLILMLKPTWLFEFIVMMGGIWAVVVGMMQLYIALGTKKEDLKNKVVLIISGILSVAVGVFLFLKPDVTSVLMMQIFGVVSIIVGIVMLMFAFKIYRLWKRVKKALAVEEKQKQEQEQKEIQAKLAKAKQQQSIEEAEVIEDDDAIL